MIQLRKKPLRLPATIFKGLHFSLHVILTGWLGFIFMLGFNDELGGDPVQYLLDFTGIGALHLLLASLCVSIIAQSCRFSQIMVLRRPVGLYAALYAVSHFFVFIAFELQFEISLIISEIIKRPYITVGFTSFVILTLLAITSFPVIRRKMGSAWQKLHNFTYLAVILGALHYLWLVKSAWLEPLIYLLFALSLLCLKFKKIRNIFK